MLTIGRVASILYLSSYARQRSMRKPCLKKINASNANLWRKKTNNLWTRLLRFARGAEWFSRDRRFTAA